jgi:hypothetical protein
LFPDQPLKSLDEVESIPMTNSFELRWLNHKRRTRSQPCQVVALFVARIMREISVSRN